MTVSQPRQPQEVTRTQFLSIYTVVALPMFLGAVLGTAVTGAVVYTQLPDVDVKDLVRTDAEQGGPEVIRAFQVAYVCAGVVAVLGVVNASRVPRINI